MMQFPLLRRIRRPGWNYFNSPSGARGDELWGGFKANGKIVFKEMEMELSAANGGMWRSKRFLVFYSKKEAKSQFKSEDISQKRCDPSARPGIAFSEI